MREKVIVIEDGDDEDENEDKIEADNLNISDDSRDNRSDSDRTLASAAHKPRQTRTARRLIAQSHDKSFGSHGSCVLISCVDDIGNGDIEKRENGVSL